MIRINKITKDNFNEHSLDDYNRIQHVKKMYRLVDGEYRLQDESFVSDWDLDKKRHVALDLISDDYLSYAAFEGEKVVGFIGLFSQMVEGRMILDLMHVSYEYRRKGLGRKLFSLAEQVARENGATSMYIAACPSEETIAFYEAMGASVTKNVIDRIVDLEPTDIQMEKPISVGQTVTITIEESHCDRGLHMAGEEYSFLKVCPPLCSSLWNKIYPEISKMKEEEQPELSASCPAGKVRVSCKLNK